MAGHVTVACKLPNGLMLQLSSEPEDRVEATPLGMRTYKQARVVSRIRVNGPKAPFGTSPRCRIIRGYAITQGVDAEFWKKWLVQNAQADYVLQKLIVASEGDIEKAIPRDVIRTGFEPADPRNLPKMTTPTGTTLRIETDEEAKVKPELEDA